MISEHVVQWLDSNPLNAVQVDCATAVMLKILDGKCKMFAEEKIIMALLYEQVKTRPGELLGKDIHALIADAGGCPDEQMKNHIYEKRVLAETVISRPVMKAFKAMIRQQGLFDLQQSETA